MQTHCPSLFSLHKLTLLSPPDTAKIFPVRDQLTLQTTSSKVCKIVGVQVTLSSLVQITTRLSWEHEAIIERGKPIEGAHETSRIQSVCISSLLSSVHWSASSIHIWNNEINFCLLYFYNIRVHIAWREDGRWARKVLVWYLRWNNAHVVNEICEMCGVVWLRIEANGKLFERSLSNSGRK